MNDEQLREFQAQAMIQLQRDMAAAGAAQSNPSHLRAYKTALLLSLIQLRNVRKLSQTQLAAKVGTSQSVIARIESGKGNPSLKTLLKLAHALEANLLFYK